jgi:DNA-binding CsgD family transcriptional regulator
LGRLRKLANNIELAERLPLELCRSGFSGVLFSLIRGNMYPRRPCQPLPESALVRDKAPVLVNVCMTAPVYVWQTPVALLHADAPAESGDVGAEDRDLLGLFAEGLGAIMERNIVAERMQALHSAAQQHVQRLHSLTGRFAEDPDLTKCSENTADDETISGDIAEYLTRRERQVLNLMAAGKTNAQIAARLFVSEGTVKSHVRHIVRKLGASDCAEAVARYQASRRYPPSAAETLISEWTCQRSQRT